MSSPTPPLSQRISTLKAALSERILVLDGATGTYLQDQMLTADDFGGETYEGCNEYLVHTRPDIISTMHRAYLEAGADIIETNTFGGTALVLEEYDLQDKTTELNHQAAVLARQAVDAYTPKKCFVAGSIGPTTKAITVTGGVSFEKLRDHFFQQAQALVEGGVDYLLVETAQDTRNVKAALIAIEQLNKQLGIQVPVGLSCTIETMGTMLAGQGVEAFYTSTMHHDLLYIGMNCGTGPAFMTDHLRALAQLTPFPLAVVPNAGLPDEEGNYIETPQLMTDVLQRFLDNGWLNLIGGCCGTTPAHITQFAQLAAAYAPRELPQLSGTLVSGIDFLEMTENNRPILVGERTNTVGSRRFKRLIEEEAFEQASEIARRQVNAGAQVIDINLANPDRDELADMEHFLEYLIQKVKVPLMIDSTDAAVIEAALPYCQGKSIINSINLEDGEERFEQVVPMAKKYGAALIVGTIDEDPEQGMGITRERKVEIATRSVALLTKKYGIPIYDIIIDPLVFPCGTGDENYVGSAAETIAGITLIKQALPCVKTVLGISNVSFGLPTAGREVLNAVFLQHCIQAGLDMAIVNSESLRRFSALPEHEIALADNVLFNHGDNPIAAFAEYYRTQAPTIDTPTETLSLDERLAQYIVMGSKDGLIEDLELASESLAPLGIINGPLMTGMDKVGQLFNDNKMIVAEVLQSAEAMKAAVNHLEPKMEKKADSIRGTMLLATVKGDVHDIGKNLVDIILSNNGFNVINLGIKCPPEQLIAACKTHQPDLIGLSGLLVKSAQQMVVTAQDLQQAGIQTPVLVGGAALSRRFVFKNISPAYGEGMVAYANDAMHGLDLAKRITNADLRITLEADLKREAAQLLENMANTANTAAPVHIARAARSSKVATNLPLPEPADTNHHLFESLNLDEVWNYLNPQMLFGKHLGIKGSVKKLILNKDPKVLALLDTIEKIKTHCRNGGMQISAMWRFFPATSEGNQLFLHDPNEATTKTPLATFDFPRQNKEDGICLADFVLPPQQGKTDHVALFVVSAGKGIRATAEAWKAKGDYLKSYALQAFALESAEAAAEWSHAKLRALWGIPDPLEMSIAQLLQARYRGSRYSFGYPACPNLEDQRLLFELLKPERIGVELTEGDMMEPEASVSAIAFHHPNAVYFSAGKSVLEDDDDT